MSFKGFVLISAALGVGAIGTGYLISPQYMLAFYSVTLDSINEASIIRSVYGGLFLGFAVLFLAGALKQEYSRPALLALLAFMGGFAVGRVISLLADGVPSPLVLGLFGLEVTFASAAAYLLARSVRVSEN